MLADIQLADGSSGIEAVNEILGTSVCRSCLSRRFPERLLTGDRPEPTFLITKPFQAENIKAITSQALFFDMKAKPRGDVCGHLGRRGHCVFQPQAAADAAA